MKLSTPIFSLVTLLVSAVALPAAAATNSTELLGDPAPPSASSEKIPINPDTKSVNVEADDVVTFVVGDKTFTWNFDGTRNGGAFNLAEVAPPGTLDHPVIAYVAADPQWT